jgi:hypothetical protein
MGSGLALMIGSSIHCIASASIRSSDALQIAEDFSRVDHGQNGNANGFLSKLNLVGDIKMKSAKLTLMFLACTAAIPALAQNTTDSRCGTTNYDSSRGTFTIVNPTPGTPNQQCFVTVVPKTSWTGGTPNLSTSQLVEGNYEITLSGGGGGGGGGSGSEREHGRTEAGNGGSGGDSAVPVTTVRYLNPGVYRMTIGSGGQGGTAGPNGEHVARSGGRGADGGPTSVSNSGSGETVAGFDRAESWNGSYSRASGAYSGAPARNGERGADGGGGGGGGRDADRGYQGGNGFIKLALKDPVMTSQPAPVQYAPATSAQGYAPPAPADARPAKKDRN